MSKVAIVFGGSRGIGAAIALRLAHDGFDVALTYASRRAQADDIAARIERSGQRALAIQADSGDREAIRDAVERVVGRFGTLDAAIINAGVLRLGPIEDLPVEDLDLMLSVNVRGVFLAIQAAVRRMRTEGRVVTIGSNTAVRPGRGSSAYSMTKAAVAAMVKAVAQDLAPRRITVNNVQPGPIETDMTASMIEMLAERIPVGRVGRPDEVAALISHLVGDDGGYITGASFTIDGGFSL